MKEEEEKESRHGDDSIAFLRLDPAGRVPLYLQLRAAIERGVATGELKPGQRIPPEPDLCTALGVSTTTVKNALAPLVASGMLHRRPRHGTFVAEAARMRTVRVDVLVPSPEDTFQKALLTDLARALRERHRVADISEAPAPSGLRPDHEAVVCLGPWPPAQAAMLDELARRTKAPVLLLDIPSMRPWADCVHVDNAGIADSVVTRLVEKGARRVFYLGMGLGREGLNDEGRQAGYAAAMRRAGYDPHPSLILQPDGIRDLPGRLLSALAEARADAVFFAVGGHYGSLLAGFARPAARGLDIRVGGVGLEPAGILDTVDCVVPPADLADAAASLLCARLDGDRGAPKAVAVGGDLHEPS